MHTFFLRTPRFLAQLLGERRGRRLWEDQFLNHFMFKHSIQLSLLEIQMRRLCV